MKLNEEKKQRELLCGESDAFDCSIYRLRKLICRRAEASFRSDLVGCKACDSWPKAQGSHKIILRRANLDAEGTAAAASALDVRVIELEPGAFDGLDVVDFDAFEVHLAHLVDENLEAVVFVHVVGIVDRIFKGHVIGESRAAAANHGNAQGRRSRRLLRHDFLHLVSCYWRHGYHKWLLLLFGWARRVDRHFSPMKIIADKSNFAADKGDRVSSHLFDAALLAKDSAG